MKRWIWYVCAITAVTAVVALSAAFLRPRHPLAELASAVGEQRAIEPRLSGGFRYAAPARSRNATNAPVSQSADVRIAIGRLEKRAVSAGPEVRAALGVAYLVGGDTARAVLALEEATDRSEPPSGSLSDLSAAYLVRAAAPEHAQDVVRALTIAERAVQAEPRRPEAWFNRALALETLSLRAEARGAWQAYLRVDGTSGWADEARQHVAALSESREAGLEFARGALEEAVRRGDRTAIDRAIADSPELLRQLVERYLLLDWPQAALAGHCDDAAGVLDRARPAAEGLLDRYGDGYYLDDLVAARRASSDRLRCQQLASAHDRYRAAVTAYDNDRIGESTMEFRGTIDTLVHSRSPLSWAAQRYIAAGEYYANDLGAALRMSQDIRGNPAMQRYPRVRAQAIRLAGLIHVISGDFAAGLVDYEAALAIFRSSHDVDNETQMYTSIAEDHHFLGDSVSAWASWVSALQRMDRVRELRVRHLILQGASTAALREELPEAALHFQEAALENAQRWKRPPAVVLGYLNRAEIFARLGQPSRVLEDLAAAERYLATVNDPLLSRRHEARILLARGETEYRSRPAQAVDALTRALSYFERTGTSWRLAGAYLARGRAYLAAGDTDRAERDFAAGIGVFERMRASISSEALRSSYFEQPWDLFTEMIRLQLQRHDSSRALRYAEQARARTLFDAVGSDGSSAPELPSDVRAAMPSRVAMVYFAALDDRLLIWVIAREHIVFVEHVVRQADLARTIARYTDSPAGHDRTALADLYDSLIRPIASYLPAGMPLVVVPDGVLHRVPFAALVQRETGRYLVADHAVATAPSLSLFLHLSAAPALSADSSAKVLVVGNPRVDGPLATLPDAEREAHEIAAVYANATLLTGDAATKSRFITAAGTYDVVHFAGHAISNDDYPALSHLLMARGDGEIDGTLFAHEIARMAFERTRLVVLAACRTSAGRVRRGEGVFSLARPFLAAGVPAVVASLWDVDDRAAKSLFVAFHTALAAHHAPADALRLAQLSALAGQGGRQDPFAWGSFTVIGGARLFDQSAPSVPSN